MRAVVRGRPGTVAGPVPIQGTVAARKASGGAQGTRCTGVFFGRGCGCGRAADTCGREQTDTPGSVFFVPVAGGPRWRPRMSPPDAGSPPAAGARVAAECAVSRPVGSGSRFVRRCGTFCGRFSGPNVEKSLRELGISWNISYLWMQKMSFAANNIIRIS